MLDEPAKLQQAVEVGKGRRGRKIAKNREGRRPPRAIHCIDVVCRHSAPCLGVKRGNREVRRGRPGGAGDLRITDGDAIGVSGVSVTRHETEARACFLRTSVASQAEGLVGHRPRPSSGV